ncbi:transcriptional regulator [Sphaerisporangium rufum]|uniref:Transcriptional regulator n=1 Tax=Sphaerisporangium rufum TaxID=1381558 RepID=A0A919R8Y3_9ACTN|nr:GntR family transcriptional regulator [Sphaerisporangium rufum]GII81831.1 transcriptional regulator [Sphaerisporangium rufum]
MAHRAPLSIRRDMPVPYYEQLKRLIVQQIDTEGLQPGDLLPSEIELCDRYDVSRTVVRQAIGDLVNEGLLHRMRGKGTFVARPKLREQFIESTLGFFEDMTTRGHKVVSDVLSLDLVEAGSKVAEALSVPEKTLCIELVRLRSVNDETVAFTKSYVNSSSKELLADLRQAELSTTSLYRVLEDNWEMRIESGHRSLEASKAKGMLARLLHIRSGEPVLYIESVGHDGNGKAVEYFQAWHRADRTRLEMNVVRDRRPASTDFMHR